MASMAALTAARATARHAMRAGMEAIGTPARGMAPPHRMSPTIARAFATAGADRATANILWFDELGMADVPLVGGKCASLGEMYRQLTPMGVRIPNGFAVTAHAYHHFLEEAGIADEIKKILTGLDTSDIHELETRGALVRGTILHSEMPSGLKQEIADAYGRLEEQYHAHVDTAVRSSATAEDLPDASFAGQQDTYLNVRGELNLLDACRRCFSSLFTNRAISYRQARGYDHFQVGLSIGVQKMVRSDLASSGVMFSLDTESGFRDVVTITGAWGLGENVVQGAVNPDEWIVFKPSMRMSGVRDPILVRRLGSKEKTMVYSQGAQSSNGPVHNKATTKAKRQAFCLNDHEVELLGRWAMIIEEHYAKVRGTDSPMDMEWAKDGRTGELFIVQARPETVHSQRDNAKLVTYKLNPTEAAKSSVITAGAAVGSRIGTGKASVLHSPDDIKLFTPGDVLVTEITDPDWEPIMKAASAVVTERGGRTCHSAIISRELGLPCVVGTGNATEVIESGDPITVDCSTGETGKVWAGELPFDKIERDVGSTPPTRTKIMLNLANPSMAFETQFLPNKGIGLARMEFIANNHVKAHPLALLHPEKLSKADQKALRQLTRGYATPRDYFISTLSGGIATLAAAFYPKPVILRFSDFKTNEYSNLLGGSGFEPKEENPMIGWRGASRYYSDEYREGFALECAAVKKVRDGMGLDNLVVMVPFCRTVDEAKAVVAEMEANGLRQADGLKVYGMCEIPSNVLSADLFLDVFDGFSIGSNDLTQLTLGVDRDSERVAHVYDERNHAVKALISQVIEVCKRRGKYVGICGQAPSDLPDFAEFLVEQGIESMSLNPDTVVSTTFNVAAIEERLGATPKARKTHDAKGNEIL